MDACGGTRGAMRHERIPLRLEGTSLAVRVPNARAACALALILAVLAVEFSPLRASAVSRSATVHTLRRQTDDTSRAEYQDLVAKMPDWDSYSSGFCVGPETRRVLKDVFALVQNRAVSYLDAHPDATTDALVARIKNLGDEKNPWPLEATVAQLRRGTHAAYVVAVNVQFFGTLFVVSRTAARSKFRVAWDIKTVAERHHRKRDLLGDWANFALCKRPPLTGEVHGLPRNRRGQARFYVDAIYNTNGSSALKQLSIWEWRDTHVIPLFMQTYGSTIDREDVTFANNQLIVPTKEDSRILSSCSSCTEPEGVWTIAVTPDRIIDHGHRPAKAWTPACSLWWPIAQRRLPSTPALTVACSRAQMTAAVGIAQARA
jgi:hypothetical protein